MEDDEAKRGRRGCTDTVRVIGFVLPLVMLVWMVHMGYRLTTETRDDEGGSFEGSYIALLFGIVTVVFGLIYFLVGLTIVAELAQDLVAWADKEEDGEIIRNQEKEQKTICQIVIQVLCECGAMLYAGIDNYGLWVIRKVKTEHDNHTPKPSDAKLVKEYRMKKYTSNVRRQLMNFYDEGVPVRQAHGCIATETGEDNLPSVKDLQHEIYKEKRLKMEGGDATAMMAYFDKMQADNQNFYHAHRLDGEGRLKDVMWVDARSRVDYEEFGDVVCFDATYITNKYELPFANFVGVNHHGQSILLGCALVSHEDSDTFAWVFRKWLSCMGDKQPGAILTDQAAAMRKKKKEEELS